MAFKTCVANLAAGLGLLGGALPAAGQAPTNIPGDWPNLGAFNNRQSRNGNPYAYTSGRTLLRYTTISAFEDFANVSVDNTDLAALELSRGGPQDDPLYTGRIGGVSQSYATPIGDASLAPRILDATAWLGATSDENVIQASPTEVRRVRDRTNNNPTFPGFNYTQRTPEYAYSGCVPSAKNQGDPTVPETGYKAKYFEWRIVPQSTTDRFYGINAYIPIGTTDGPVETTPATTPRSYLPAARHFPQRYYVYEIRFGLDLNADGVPDNRIVDVFDTNTGSAGLNRIGITGRESTTVFPSNGTPIVVRLYNTVPRDPDTGALRLTGSLASDSTAVEATRAATVLVYADAAEAVPISGSIAAGAVTVTASGNAPPTLPFPEDPTANWNVTVAQNRLVGGFLNGAYSTTQDGTVISYQANPARFTAATPAVPLEKWRYSVLQESPAATLTLDDGAAGVTNTAGFVAGSLNANRIGTTYLVASSDPVGASATVTYKPTLTDGDYEIFAWLPGSVTGENYGYNVRYEIREGAALTAILVDQNPRRGWFKIGTRRFTNVTDSLPLTVTVTNNTPGGGTARFVYADAIRFVSTTSAAITSTPVHAVVAITPEGGGVPVQRRVTLVADESGKIHCLDSNGRNDGTTTEYWTYPSTPPAANPDQYRDPNLFEVVAGTGTAASGIDGQVNANIAPGSNVPKATMPTGFNLSTATVARVATPNGNRDLLYIGASNGRVYCIDMAGRGDYSAANRTPGTAARRWTFPDDYNPTSPASPIAASALGAFQGSVVFGDTSTGAPGPTVYVPAAQGRMYALDAVGNVNTRATSTRWIFPALSGATLPPITMTPTLFRSASLTGRVLFGTVLNGLDDTSGQFFSLDAATGLISWQINGLAYDPTAYVGGATNRRRTDAAYRAAGDTTTTFGSFIAGPVAVDAATLDAVPKSAVTGTATLNVDTLYVLNNNGNLYGLKIADGTLVTNTALDRTYRTSVSPYLSNVKLAYTVIQYPNRAGNLEYFPSIVIPSVLGNLLTEFARVDDYNTDGNYRQFRSQPRPNSNTSSALTGVAVSNNFLFTTDADGALFAYDNVGAAGGNLGQYPGDLRDEGPNDPRGRAFRRLRIRLLNNDGYKRLRQVIPNPDGLDSTGGLSYNDIVTGAYDRPKSTTSANPYAFEWGETLYVLVYGFPYVKDTKDGNGTVTRNFPPPTIRVTITTEGRAPRPFTVDSRQFRDPGNAPAVDVLDQAQDNPDGYKQDGFALVAIPLSNSGNTALPPGNGQITATLSTTALGAAQEFTPDGSIVDSVVNFVMANPLAVILADPVTGAARTGIGQENYNIGYTVFADSEDNLVNGTPNLSGKPLLSQLQTSTGSTNHGSTGTARVYIVDRSLMAILKDDGIGNIRMTRTNLRRQGGLVGVMRALPSGRYPGFEDSPINTPNTSLDYPDIGREQVSAVTSANGTVANPVTTNVSIAVPTDQNRNRLTVDSDASQRILTLTPVDLQVEVPRYQPPVDTANMTTSPLSGTSDEATDYLHLRHDSAGTVLAQGYFGRINVFVDSNTDSKLNLDAREVYRSFNLSSAVNAQTSILVGAPSVDLSSLAAGTGYSPVNPFAAGANGKFDPWSTAFDNWAGAYQPFSVLNDGNVNLIDLRVAKGTNDSDAISGNRPWALTTVDSDPLAWMAAMSRAGNGAPLPGDLWSNIDTTFSAANDFETVNALKTHGLVVLPKPRVTDRVATSLVANPYPRANPNIRIDRGTRRVVDPVLGATATSELVPGTTFYRLDQSKLSSAPKVGVSVPLGYPVGNYSTQIRVVENFFAFGSNSTAPVDVDNEILQYKLGVYDAYSEPITLTYKVRETRMTNRATPRTAPVIDDPSAFGVAPTNTSVGSGAYADRISYRNAAPAAMRLPDGSLVVGFESDRANSLGSLKTSRIYLSGLRENGTNFTANGTGAPAGNAPLWDLSQFVGNNGGTGWFQTGAAFPTASAGLFTGTIVPNTDSFGLPSFPAKGAANPLQSGPVAGNGLGNPLMAFVGEAQVRTQTSRAAQSKVFVSTVTVAADGTPAATTPVATLSDPLTAKGKPSILQLPTGAFVFYAETSAGQSGITVDRLRSGGAFAAPVSLGFGDGFSSVFSPSATGRTYVGADPALNGKGVVELSFSGKLRGRANAEAYLGRLRLNTPAPSDANDSSYAASVTDSGALHLVDEGNRTVEYPKAGSPFAFLPVQTLERLVGEGNGLYRARGVAWKRTDLLKRIQDTATYPISPLVQYLGTTAIPTDLLLRATAVVDRESGLVACDSRLGGKVYLDPEFGTVRFAGAFPNRNAEIRFTYQPRFLRVTPGGTASYSSVNGLFDDRFASQYKEGTNTPQTPDYWFDGAGTWQNVSGSYREDVQVRSDRYVFAYGRGAAGGGVTARPYSTTMRIGLRLPTRIATDGDGNVVSIRVQGATRPYQVDPANGRVYFMAEDEDRNVTVTYTGVNEATNQPVPNLVAYGAASFVLERNEALIPVDEAANDSALTAFLDPFTFTAGNAAVPRPPLTWLFYVSTRAGQPDVYFQTIAPRYTPFAK